MNEFLKVYLQQKGMYFFTALKFGFYNIYSPDSMLVNIQLILEVFVERVLLVKILHFIDSNYIILTFPQNIKISNVCNET